jgi:ferredoxin
MINGVKIDQEQCTGCGECERSCAAVFCLSDSEYAKVSGRNVSQHAKKVLVAYHGCPVQAIELDSEDASLLSNWYAVRLWRWWVRAIHINLSMVLCVLFLFFGFTGFVANRPELFRSESQQTVPANIALEQGELGGFFKTQFGEGFDVANFQQADGLVTLDLENPEKIRCAVELDEESRIYTVTETRPLPKGSLSLTEDVLAKNLAKTLRGKLDERSVEKDEDTIYFNMESVWVNCAVMVDLERREYEVNRESVPWVKAFVLLHKSKQAGVWQRLLIDIAGIGMVIVALSGMILAFQAGAVRTRVIAFVLTGGSILVTLWMAAGR